VSAPQLPADESLQGGVALVDEGASPALAQGQRLAESLRLAVVENVALAVVGGGAAGRLVAELRTPLNGQSLKQCSTHLEYR